MTAKFFEAHIPQQLIERARWICWQRRWRNDKYAKMPINPRTGCPVDVTDLSAAVDFETAVDGMNRFGCDGVGVVLDGDGLIAIDIDTCVTWADGSFRLEEKAETVIRPIGSYTEFSPSRRGIHIFAFGSLPEAGRRNRAIEIYGNKRFMTVTGDRVPGCPASIEHRDKELRALYVSFFLEHAKKIGPGSPQDARSHHRPSLGYPGNVSDDDLLDRARRARNGALFRALFDDGSLAGYGSDSEADLALCLILAFWTGGDRERMDRLFRQSARMRDKKWNREDYRSRTIDAAIRRVQVSWKPRR